MQYKSVKPAEQQGFTLIEVMVVVVIIAILASIAFPSYQNYVLRSGRTDARDALLNISQQLERHYTLNNSYATYNSAPATSPAGFYSITLTKGATTYTITAEPASGSRQTKDSCKSFTINQAGVKTSTPAGCW
ncbi:methylation site containing protein [Alishewanella jeotgali KCTC 22429]|uniref:Methylation site containing protein n=2 Tax=Alishewanella jeotgali TaxID=545533 RepID=H3ZCF5_9ALTE|nr:methylation site containing protein [Alishewanella jeotgali KCTC 22429]